jgi:hypothetical protein
MGRYLFQFTWVFLLLSVIVAVFFTLTNIDPPSAMGFITIMAASSAVGQTFGNKEGRVLTRGERATFATFASLIAIVASVAIFLVTMLIAGVGFSYAEFAASLSLGDMPPVFLLIGLAIALVVSWLVIYFFMNFNARMALKKKKPS